MHAQLACHLAIGIVPDSASRTASRRNCSSNACRPRRFISHLLPRISIEALEVSTQPGEVHPSWDASSGHTAPRAIGSSGFGRIDGNTDGHDCGVSVSSAQSEPAGEYHRRQHRNPGQRFPHLRSAADRAGTAACFARVLVLRDHRNGMHLDHRLAGMDLVGRQGRSEFAANCPRTGSCDHHFLTHRVVFSPGRAVDSTSRQGRGRSASARESPNGGRASSPWRFRVGVGVRETGPRSYGSGGWRAINGYTSVARRRVRRGSCDCRRRVPLRGRYSCEGFGPRVTTANRFATWYGARAFRLRLRFTREISRGVASACAAGSA